MKKQTKDRKWIWICPNCGSHTGEVTFAEKVKVVVTAALMQVKLPLQKR